MMKTVDVYEPRKFFAPDGYLGSSDLAAIHAIVGAYQAHQEKMPPLDAHGIAALSTMRMVIEAGMQAYHLEEDVGELLKRTDLPREMTFADLQLPFTAFAICPHKSLLKNEDGSYVGFIEITNCKLNGGDRDGINVLCQNLRGNKTVWSQLQRQYYLTSPLSDVNIPASSDGEAIPLTASDQEVIYMATRVAIGSSMMLINYREQIIDGPAIKRIKARDGGKVELFNPRWIGKISAQKTRSMPGHGTHLSPSSHWRRGHWRRQPVGEGRRDNRMTWIRPIFVNPDPKESTDEPQVS